MVSCGGQKAGEQTGQQGTQTVVLKFASFQTGAYVDKEQAFVDRFNARCGPAYRIEYYPSEQMVGMAELLDAGRTGVADLVSLVPNAYAAHDPRLGAIELPFLFNNIDAHVEALPKLAPLYNEVLEQQFNQKLLCVHNFTATELLSTRPVKTMEDWRGLVVHAVSPVISNVVTSLGGSAVSRPFPEAYELLQKKTVEATFNAPGMITTYKLNEVAKNLTVAYFSAAMHGISVNLNSWNKLPADVQKALVEEAEAYARDMDEWCKGDEYEGALKRLEQAGVQVYQVPNAERERWKEACRPYLEKQLQTLGDFGQQVLKIAEEVNQKHPIQ
jgi:TRAP-type C4-dicarboxylate transport system substrate-binding protein